MNHYLEARRAAAQVLEAEGIAHYLVAILAPRGTRWHSKGDSVWLNGVAVVLNRFLTSAVSTPQGKPAGAKKEGAPPPPQPTVLDRVRERAVRILEEAGISSYLVAHFSEAVGTQWSLKGDRAWFFGMARVLGLFLERGLRPTSDKEDAEDERVDDTPAPKSQEGLDDTDWKIPDTIPKDW